MKTDIKNRSDIEKLVTTFYGKVQEDLVISYFFNDVAKVNWNHHLPKMCDFFENILFSSGNYDGNPMQVHEELHKKSEVRLEHFQHWNTLFDTTVDELFVGAKAEEIKQRATNIAAAMMHTAHR
ncbi:group III truncated hemoglobin [Flavobacterium franklandianum]|uniref:Group III truncated hemoglobin n=1 Tax=Flavobacterium franklandianum TaxID=2594430 RepID=A0A553CJF4_9FLAO|nr:group III truncated hemoglobin [Flavobacterium franklandianum]TRX20634.1 group III truncated hemoglobin [Flavobacterium franklandianum]